MNRSLAVSPDGRSLAYSALDGRVYVRRFDSLDLVSLPIGLTAVGPIFSPDGHHIAAFTAGTAELRRIPATGGPVQPIGRGSGVGRGAAWAPDGTIYLATTDPASGLLSVRDTGGELKAVTTPDAAAGELDHLWPDVLPEGRGVVFTVLKNGSFDIGVLDVASGATKVLLRGGSNALYLASGHLLYSSAGALRAVPFDPVRLELRGESVPVPLPVMITGSGVVNAAATSAGTLVYAAGDPISVSERRLLWVDRQGREESIESSPQPFAVPRSAPDGLRIVAHLERDIPDIVVLDIRRKSLRPLTLAKAPSYRPAWSIDGRWIYFRSDTEGQGIYRKAGDGTGAMAKITSVVGDASVHSLSPDGTWLVYAQIDPITVRDLWMIDPEGAGKPQPLVVEPGDQSNAVISPDGRWIAYHASEVGEIYVRPFPNVADGRWQVVPSGAKWPLWSRDGTELFYVSGSSIMSVAVEGHPAFQWSSPKRLFDASYSGFAGLAGPRNYDLSPDGKRFLVIKDSGLERAPAREFLVVENWFEELNRLAPPTR
jgi:serine/threonine-protein kinase